MMMRGLLKLLVILALSATLAGCRSSYSWHQKMTVIVETPDGIRQGASVVSVKFYPVIHMKRNDGYENKVRGEAVVADLGKGKYLFALLGQGGTMSSSPFIAARAFEDDLVKLGASELQGGRYNLYGDYQVWLPRIVQLEKNKPVAVKPRNVPLLVTFTDITDPKTVKRVDPDNLAATFGEGYRLKSITLEITGEPVTKGKMERVLPCLKSGKACVPVNFSLPYGHPLRNILNSAFWRK